jgi:signal transduction histidine kinase
MGRRAKPVTGKAEARRPSARKSPKSEGTRVRELEKRLAEALAQLETSHRERAELLERQTATSEILNVISAAPTDASGVFDAICHSAARLFDASAASIIGFDGELMRVLATRTRAANPRGEKEYRAVFPRRPDPGLASGRAVLERSIVQVPDTECDPSEQQRAVGRAVGFRRILAVPMARHDEVIGTIVVTGADPGEYSGQHVALLKTFADQAVIAIENVRLFKELETRNRDLTQALQQQTATSEILRVISNSPTAVGPVFEAIVTRGRHLCQAQQCLLVGFDGEMLTWLASDNFSPAREEALRSIFPYRPTRTGTTGRVVLDRAIVHIPDVLDEPDHAHKDVSIRAGARAQLAVPMFRENEVIGALHVARPEPGPFSQAQIDLLKTFADQAVIAIENVRLFTELQASNRELTTALDTQTATSDILRVISGAQTDVQPVFDAIMASAVRLLGAYSGLLTRVAGDGIEIAALTSTDDAGDAALRATYPYSIRSERTQAQVIRDRVPLNIADAHTDPRLPETQHALARGRGFRSQVVVPMLRHHEAVGTISVTRREPGGFTDDEIALLKTFADQAVIAIENARLFTELQARTQELTRSVGELTALGEVGRALSSTLEVEVVLDTIVARANDLIGADGCTIFEYDEAGEQFHLRATRNLEPRLVALARGTPLRKGDQGILGQLAMRREAVQVPDITDGAYSSPISDALIEAGYRAVVAVPLIREDHLIGALTMNRKTAGAFPRETIELLQTFATQSALAIQNARLFREVEVKSRELEIASQHKSEFLASMSHELRTPLNAIIGFSDVLLQGMFGETNEKQTEYLRDILASGQHLLSLINDILDLSKIEAGRMELELADFHLPSAIDDALLLMRERAGRRGLRLERHIDERLGEIWADQRKVKQVLLNLLSNAVKFTPEGGRIDVRAALVDGTAEITVTDTGIGIAPEDQAAVFEEFRQVGAAEKKAEGTGLGLALCRKLVELHGGRIRVTSQLRAGSTFTFTLPVRRQDKAVSLQ